MEGNNNKRGRELFLDFASKVPEGLSDFDYFSLLDHISQKKIDKDLIAAIFCERNKPFEDDKNEENK